VDVFASCYVDGTLWIWDTRHCEQSTISVKAPDADVNVISWNRWNDFPCISFPFILDVSALCG
jgi:hypothetical protein